MHAEGPESGQNYIGIYSVCTQCLENLSLFRIECTLDCIVEVLPPENIYLQSTDVSTNSILFKNENLNDNTIAWFPIKGVIFIYR